MRSNRLSYRPVNLEQLTWAQGRLRRGGYDMAILDMAILDMAILRMAPRPGAVPR